LQPDRIVEEFSATGTAYLHLFRDLPGELRAILSQLRSGRMRLEFEHRGLKSLDMTLDRVSNRIAFAIVLAALIVGSSVIIHSGIPPRWHDIPVIGLIGFLVAGVMGFWLLLSIIRHGRM
jgi:ubiquinone biosynthesis protein